MLRVINRTFFLLTIIQSLLLFVYLAPTSSKNTFLMKERMKRLNLLGTFLVLAVLTFSVYSCKDDEGDPPAEDNTPKTKTEMLTTGSWLMKSGTITPSITVDIFGTTVTLNNYWELLAAVNGTTDAEPCLKDNLLIFNTDSTVVLDEGAIKCDPADPQTDDGGEWRFIDNETKVVFSSFPLDPLKEERTMKVLELTNTNLNLEMDYQYVVPLKGDTSDHVILLKFEKQ